MKFLLSIFLFLSFQVASQAEAAQYCRTPKTGKRGYWYHRASSSICKNRITPYRRCRKGFCGKAYTTSGSNRRQSTRTRVKTSGSLKGINIIGSAKAQGTNCLPASIKGVLQSMRRKGWKVTIFSAYRSPRYNARLRRRSKNVAKNSKHIQCRAADIRVRGASYAAVTRYLRGVRPGGLGIYCNSFWHIDNGRRRQWGSCGKRRRGRRRYKGTVAKASKNRSHSRNRRRRRTRSNR